MRSIRFVSAPGGSAFMHELLGVVAFETERVLGGSDFQRVVLEEGPLTGGPDDVFVVVPHEYFRVLPAAQHPDRGTQARTIGFCVEHPGTETFEWTVRTSAPLGARLDINDDSAAALSALGLTVERFHLGYSERLDRWHGDDRERPIDVLHLGTTDPRRDRFLTFATESLDEHELFFAIPPHEPMVKPRPDFYMGDAKLELLATTKILVNLHRGASHSFEWVRALEAMCNGAVVLTEHSGDLAPLVAGRHLLAGAPHRLPSLADHALRDPRILATIRADTYQWLREERTMEASARLLLDVAASLAHRGADGRSTSARAGSAPLPTAAVPWPSWSAGLVHRHGDEPVQEPAATADSWYSVDLVDAEAVAAVTVIVCGPPRPGDLAHYASIASGAGLTLRPGVRTSSFAAATDSAAPRSVLLAAGDRLTPRCLGRWLAALADERVDAVYSMVVTAEGRLRSSLPFEPSRMVEHDLLELASAWRTPALRSLTGNAAPASAHQLWSAAARADHSVQLIPRPAVRRTA